MIKERFNYLFSKRKKLPSDTSDTLDTFRWMSALAVCVGHSVWVFYTSSLSDVNPWHFIFGLIAQASVMIFFVLSGFFICQSMCGSIKNGNLNVKSYAQKRLNRLYPPLLLALFLSLIIFFISPYFFTTNSRTFIDNGFLARQDIQETFLSFIGSALFLNGFLSSGLKSNPALWSLPYEFWYYVSICFIPFLYKKRVLAIVFMAVVIVLFFKKMFVLYAFVWYAGAILAIAYNHQFKVNKKLMYMLGFISFISSSFFAINHGLNSNHMEVYTRLPIIPMYNFSIGLLFSVILYFILNRDLKVGAFKPSYASFSYTNYVIHMPIMFFVYGVFQYEFIGMNRFLLFLSSILIAFVLFFISKKMSFIEKIKLFK